ncbi:hypothetical protein CO173_03625 [Candidatus Uhrbacteria bacterium CG_4_9_14_3_um_filter_41_35]|uniref:Uncharacterized protein n=1 Tax=Candidatus Uhrbacteria bacterium CG_4_9_14_3_um_filter_41_35 TaxID=1975034 RepID=A0A2M7XE10_9BACT|nr:MAG: hypothetical protein COV92_02125 [Candidatus Uhrbacteria bacterium CG11_big_fil_rev_8_21_14_0_20_41_9]PJA46103.1 MAG: hypothetical protein CO173_03625 [Candidatus Uhrbacteria bacterium CG_4_9_14_3_um_filter_41_35]
MAFELDKKNNPSTSLEGEASGMNGLEVEGGSPELNQEVGKLENQGASSVGAENFNVEAGGQDIKTEPKVIDHEPTKEPKDKLTVELEQLLEKDLKEVFKTLSPEDGANFQLQGETLVQEIRDKIKTGAKVKPEKVAGMLRKWLLLLPGNGKVLAPYYEMMLSKMAVQGVEFWNKQIKEEAGDQNKI